MKSFLLHTCVGVVSALLLAEVAGACGRHKTASPTPPASSRYNLAQTQDQLADLPTPQGVSGELFQTLKQALSAELAESAKRTAVPIPEDQHFEVRDITALYEYGQWLLRWGYENDGDYNQDGVVTISDITPLAIHFAETVDEDRRWPTPTSQPVDGNNDECISIADITPLAATFCCDVQSYRIEGTNDEAGAWETVGSIPFVANIADYGRLAFEISLGPAPSFRYFRVVPLDHDGEQWETSSTVDLEEMAPRILAVHPWSGQSSQAVTCRAFVGGEQPLAYEWDFGGGAEPQTSEDPYPLITLGEPGHYPGSLTVSNAFGSDTYLFTLSIQPAQWEIQTVAVEPNEAQWPTSVAFAPDGEPSVAWWVWIGISGSAVRFAHFDGSNWESELVDSGAEGPGYTLSLAYDLDGRAGIAYENPDNAQLTFARLEGDGWEIEEVPGTIEASWSELAFDPEGNPRIVYEEYSGGLFLASREGETWAIETIEPESTYTAYPQLRADPLGKLHVMYTRAVPPGPSVPELIYAFTTDGEWESETVTDDVSTFAFALNPTEQPAAVYATSHYETVFLATRDDDTWTAEELPRDPYLLGVDALAFMPSGEAVLAFSRGGNPEWLVVARQSGEDWIVQEIDSAPEALRGVDLAISLTGRTAVSYETFYFGEEPSLVKIAVMD